MTVFRLSDDHLVFPDPEWAGPEGLLAVGGDLTVERLLLAYRHGIFPWYGEGEPILWWSPDPRCVLIPQEVHVSRRLERVLRRGTFQLTCNRSFDRVIESCAAVRVAKGEETWLLPAMQEAYRALHHAGYAHSIEAWIDGELAGGLYGVAMGHAFFGESMFHHVTDASKVVLVTLACHLAANGFELFDCQVSNPHLLSMGARNMPRREFLTRLRKSGCGDDQSCGPVAFPGRLDTV